MKGRKSDMIDKFYDLIEDRIPIPNKYKMRKDKNFFIALPQNVGVLVSLNSIAGFILYNCDGKKKHNRINRTFA